MRKWIMCLTIVVLLLAGCGGTQPPTTKSPPTSGEVSQPPTVAAPLQSTDTLTTTTMVSATNTISSTVPITSTPSAATLHTIKVAFPYIPNVQFAPLYVAVEKGYYAEQGLQVTFDYMYENEAVQLVAQGQNQFAFVSGISVFLARQSGMPVKTVATITQQFPVVFFSKAANTLKQVSDLQGKTIGIPGKFGASYYGLLATLYANNMKERDLNISDVGFNQLALIQQDKIQVAIGYAMNEPIQLRDMGEQVDVLRVADIYPLVSDGIITTQEMIDKDPQVVQAFVAATLHGLQDTLNNPDEAFTLSLKHIPEIGNTDLQRKILQETTHYWQGEKLGLSNLDMWEKTRVFLRESQVLNKEVTVEESVTNEFVR